jgi:hypothetical protein
MTSDRSTTGFVGALPRSSRRAGLRRSADAPRRRRRHRFSFPATGRRGAGALASARDVSRRRARQLPARVRVDVPGGRRRLLTRTTTQTTRISSAMATLRMLSDEVAERALRAVAAVVTRTACPPHLTPCPGGAGPVAGSSSATPARERPGRTGTTAGCRTTRARPAGRWPRMASPFCGRARRCGRSRAAQMPDSTTGWPGHGLPYPPRSSRPGLAGALVDHVAAHRIRGGWIQDIIARRRLPTSSI